MRKAIGMLMASLMVMLCVIPTIASTDEEAYCCNYDANNSFQVTVTTTQKKTFTTEDFPEIACSDVYVAEMGKTTNGYTYTLILVCDGVEDIDAEMDKAEEAGYLSKENDYITADESTVINLAEQELFVKVGEEKELQIANYSGKNFYKYFTGIMITYKQDANDAADNNKNLFADCGIDQLLTEKEAEEKRLFVTFQMDGKPQEGMEYLFATVNVNDNASTLEQYIAVIQKLAQVDGIEEIRIYGQELPGGLDVYENWTMTDETIASLREIGGEPYSPVDATLVNKTAVITGIKPGLTSVKVSKAQDSWNGTATCSIGVYLPGDVNLDNEVTADDALEVLKHVVKLTQLPKIGQLAGDVNENNEITADDALEVLQIVVNLK